MKEKKQRKLRPGLFFLIVCLSLVVLGVFLWLIFSTPANVNLLVLYDDTVQPELPGNQWTDIQFDVNAVSWRHCWRHASGDTQLRALCEAEFEATLSLHADDPSLTLFAPADVCIPTAEPCNTTSQCCQTYATPQVCNTVIGNCTNCTSGPILGPNCTVNEDCCDPLVIGYCCTPGISVCAPNRCSFCGGNAIFCNGPNQTDKAPCCLPGYTCENFGSFYACFFPPTEAPTSPTTESPTETPTDAPTDAPTEAPTDAPTVQPTGAPTTQPTTTPTNVPLGTPTLAPTPPTPAPTVAPTRAPTVAPTSQPTTLSPTTQPTMTPSLSPTGTPVGTPTLSPTAIVPTMMPTPASSCVLTVATRIVIQYGGVGAFVPLTTPNTKMQQGAFVTSKFRFSVARSDVIKFQFASTCPSIALVPVPLDVSLVGYPSRPVPTSNVSALLTVTTA